MSWSAIQTDIWQILPESLAGWALLVSILSLAWGVISYLLNRRRADRAYNAANVPALKCGLSRIKSKNLEIDGRVHTFWGNTTGIVAGVDAVCTWLGFQLENLSTNIAITEIKLSVHLARPRKGATKLFSRDWVSFYSISYSGLEPKENIFHHPNTRLEVFVTERIPDVLLVTGGYKPHDGYYEVLRYEPLSVVMRVGYRPGVTGTKPQRIIKSYKLVPQLGPSEGDSCALRGWKLEEKPDSLWLRILNSA